MLSTVTNINKKKLIILHGVSGSGKTSLAKHVEGVYSSLSNSPHLNYVVCHPIGHFYKYLEEKVYGLPSGSLQDYEYKDTEMDAGGSGTFQQFFQEFYYLMKKYDPAFSTKGWIRDLKTVFSSYPSKVPIVTSLRNLPEVKALLDLQYMFDLHVLFIRIERDPAPAVVSTDSNLEIIQDQIVSQIPTNRLTFVEVVNNYSSAEIWASEIASKVVRPWTLDTSAPVQELFQSLETLQD